MRSPRRRSSWRCCAPVLPQAARRTDRASTRGAGGGLIALNPGGMPSKLPKHGRFGAFAPRRPGFAGQVVVVLRLLLQVDGPDIAEHEQSFLDTFGAGQRLKAIQWEEQGAVPSRGRLPVAAHARVVLAGEQGEDSGLALRCPCIKVVQDDLGEELHRTLTRRAARPFSACGSQGYSTRPRHQRVRRRRASVDHQSRHGQDSRPHGRHPLSSMPHGGMHLTARKVKDGDTHHTRLAGMQHGGPTAPQGL